MDDYAAVLSVYALQLHCLQLTLPMQAECKERGVAMLHAAVCAAELRELSLSCPHFRTSQSARNSKRTWAAWFADSLPALHPHSALPHLHSLVLHALPLNGCELSCLLRLLANVLECRLSCMSQLSLAALPVCGRACRKLRRLDVVVDDQQAFILAPPTSSDTMSGSPSERHSTALLFNSLRWMSSVA